MTPGPPIAVLVLLVLCAVPGPRLNVLGARTYEWEGRRVELLARAPVIITIDGIVTTVEADHLVKLAEPKMQPSWVKNEHTGEMSLHPARTSHTYFVPVFCRSSCRKSSCLADAAWISGR
jgi:hypothetical protein